MWWKIFWTAVVAFATIGWCYDWYAGNPMTATAAVATVFFGIDYIIVIWRGRA